MKKASYLLWFSCLLVMLVPNHAQTQEEQDTTELAEARILIEHNATDEDTGFQFFVDGEPWKSLTVKGAAGTVLEINAQGKLAGFGLTEGFFETNEPEHTDMPLSEILDILPAGEYAFTATTAEDNLVMKRSATLSHVIPAMPEILTPVEDEVVDGEVTISWNPVTKSITGGPVNIRGYQVIVVEDVDCPPSQSFFKNELSLYLPASQTSLTVPSEFIRTGTDYEIEVLAIETSGNQTIGIRAFSTAE